MNEELELREIHGDELELRDTTVLDRPWWPARAAILAFLGAAALGLAFGWTWAFVLAVALLTLGLALSARKPPLAGAPHTKLLVSDAAIRSGAMTVVERREIIDGALWPITGHGKLVRLRRRGLHPSIDIAVQTLDDGRALLEKLRLAPPVAKALFFGRSRVSTTSRNIVVFMVSFIAFVAGAVAATGVTHAGAAMATILAIPLLLLLGAIASVWPTTIEVGADGVVVGWLGRRKRIRYRDLDSFTTHARGIRFHLRDGTHFDVLTDRLPIGEVREAIAERVRIAIERAPVDVAPLAREGRAFGEWISALRAITRRAEGFRDVPLDAPKLWRVLEDPQVAPTAKAAAAVALSTTLDDEGKARLHLLAQSTISPKLRVALDAVTNDDDDALREAMHALEGERAER